MYAIRSYYVVQGLELLLGPLGTDIPVILLVHAVKADQLEVVAVEATGEGILQILLYGAAQEVALALQALVIRQGPFYRAGNSRNNFV